MCEKVKVCFEITPKHDYFIFNVDDLEEFIKLPNLEIHINEKEERRIAGELIFNKDWYDKYLLDKYLLIEEHLPKFFEIFHINLVCMKIYLIDENGNMKERKRNSTCESIIEVVMKEQIINLSKIMNASNSYFSDNLRFIEEIIDVYLDLEKNGANMGIYSLIDIYSLIRKIHKYFKQNLKEGEEIDVNKIKEEAEKYFKEATNVYLHDITDKPNIDSSYVTDIIMPLSEFLGLNNDEIKVLVILKSLRNIVAHLDKNKNYVEARRRIKTFVNLKIGLYISILRKAMIEKLLGAEHPIEEGDRTYEPNN